jgi:hypothetical protein
MFVFASFVILCVLWSSCGAAIPPVLPTQFTAEITINSDPLNVFGTGYFYYDWLQSTARWQVVFDLSLDQTGFSPYYQLASISGSLFLF